LGGLIRQRRGRARGPWKHVLPRRAISNGTSSTRYGVD
jgi:hypothetical protein